MRYEEMDMDMDMDRILKTLVPVVLVSMILVGCGGRASEDKPISEIAAKAKKISLNQLQGMIGKYEKAIGAKQADLTKLQKKIKQIPVKELLGEEAKKLKDDIANLTKSVRALTDRLNVYARELKSKLKRDKK